MQRKLPDRRYLNDFTEKLLADFRSVEDRRLS